MPHYLKNNFKTLFVMRCIHLQDSKVSVVYCVIFVLLYCKSKCLLFRAILVSCIRSEIVK